MLARGLYLALTARAQADNEQENDCKIDHMRMCTSFNRKLALLVLAATALLAASDPRKIDALYRAASRGDKRALQQLHALADKDDSFAQFDLAFMYANGEGVPKNATLAAQWYQRAADLGEGGAQYNLADMYRRGEGLPKDEILAVKWYRLAADKGDGQAQQILGLLFAVGDGVPKDLVTAYMWCSLAASKGVKNAKSSLDIIEKQLTPEEIAEAQRMSRQWKPHL